MELPHDDEGPDMSESELPLPIVDDDSGDLEWLLGQLEFCTEDPDEHMFARGHL